MASSSTAIFSGNSRFATDFQSSIDRAVQIASLPLTQLQQTKIQLSDQSQELNTLDTKFSALASSITALETAMGSASYFTSVSEGSVAKATVSSGVSQGSYTVEVTNMGAYTSVTSKAGSTPVTDPAKSSISTDSDFTLTVQGQGPVSIHPTAHNLNSLVDAINAKTDSTGVRASVVNINTGGHDSYHLSLQRTSFDNQGISFSGATSGDLLDPVTLDLGEPVAYKINGVTVPDGSSRTLTLAPGLTVDLLGAGTSTIDVSRNTNSIQSALASFTNAYNAAVSELDLNGGQQKGALAGQSLIYTLSQTLHNLTNYSSGAAGISSLDAMGVGFDQNGKLSMDSTYFQSATSGQLDGLLSFLGGTDTGGFLKSANDLVQGVIQDGSGILPSALSLNASESKNQDQQISNAQDRVDQLHLSLNSQMAAADALVAQMEQQSTYFTNMFQAMTQANTMYK